MDEVIVSHDDLTDEQVSEFRHAATQRGVDAVVEWDGAPHMVTCVERVDGVERFTLEPIPRPFG